MATPLPRPLGLRARALLRQLALALAAVATLAVAPGPASANRFVVILQTDLPDAVPGDGACEFSPGAGDCSLRAAVQEANALAGEDEIVLPDGVSPLEIMGPDEDLAATGDLDILGPTIVRCATDSTCVIDGLRIDRIFHVLAAGSLVLQDVRLTGGLAMPGPGVTSGMGGLVLADGPVLCDLRNVLLDMGEAERGGLLAAAFAATLQCRGGKFSGGIASGGGAVAVIQASASLSSVSIGACAAQDSGGAGSVEGGTLAVSDVEARGNVAKRGAGFAARAGGALDLTSCLLTSNVATNSGGALDVDGGSAVVTSTSIDSNEASDGAGVAVHDGLVELFKTSVTANAGARGAGVFAEGGVVESLNSTIASNKCTGAAGSVGGGLLLTGPGNPAANVFFTTILLNSADVGGGVAVEAGQLTLGMSIVAGNSANSFPDGSAPAAALISREGNIIGVSDGLPPGAFGPGDRLDVDPTLAPLVLSRARTFFASPAAGSPAVDLVPSARCLDLNGMPLRSDQVSEARPVDADGDGFADCDAGAIEWCGEDLDGNGIGDKCGCFPGDTGSIIVPPEPLLFVKDILGFAHPRLEWTDLAPAAGASTTYEVASDSLAALWSARVADGPCIMLGLPQPQFEDRFPQAEDVYYLVRGVNACGPLVAQGWGKDSFGVDEPACP